MAFRHLEAKLIGGQASSDEIEMDRMDGHGSLAGGTVPLTPSAKADVERRVAALDERTRGQLEACAWLLGQRRKAEILEAFEALMARQAADVKESFALVVRDPTGSDSKEEEEEQGDEAKKEGKKEDQEEEERDEEKGDYVDVAAGSVGAALASSSSSAAAASPGSSVAAAKGGHLAHATDGSTRFTLDTRELIFGRMADAALGVAHYMNVEKKRLLLDEIEGLSALRREFELLPLECIEAQMCARYVMTCEAGSSDVVFPNGERRMDCGPDGLLLPERRKADGSGMRLVDFCALPAAQAANLSEAEVAALRIYSTAAYKMINAPLRDTERRARGEAHPLPLVVHLIKEAVSKLRAVHALQEDANASVDLFRGMSNVSVTDRFITEGGTELAPMSATASITTALEYAASQHSGVVLRLRTRSSMERGADISFLSAFPHEKEFLLPPLVYLQARRNQNNVRYDFLTMPGGVSLQLIDVEPRI